MVWASLSVRAETSGDMDRAKGILAMKNQAVAAIILCLPLMLNGCVGMQEPSEDLLRRVPVIEMGQKEPADQQYVLLIRPGQSIPIKVTMKGPLLLQPSQTTAQIQLAHSLYIYKNWSSIDGINWDRQAFQGAVSLGLAPK